MSNTLRTFAGTLAQVAVRMGPAFGVKGAMVAAIASVALAQPAKAQASVDLVPGHVPITSEQAAIEKSRGSGISEATARNIGRVAGGVLGFGVGRALGWGNGVSEAVMAVGGVLAGGRVGEMMHGSNQTKVYTPSPTSNMADGGAVEDAGKGRALPADIQDRMTGLVIEAAASRVIAQERYAAFEKAEIELATRPGNADAARALVTSRAAFEGAMNSFRTALGSMRNAVNVAQQQGYAVQGYLESSAELSRRVDQNGVLRLDHPAIVARAAQLREKPQAASMQLLNERSMQSMQAAQRVHAVHTR